MTSLFTKTPMSYFFKRPSTSGLEPTPVPDTGDAEASSQRMQERLRKRDGRRGTVLTQTRDTQAGASRPRSTTLGGA